MKQPKIKKATLMILVFFSIIVSLGCIGQTELPESVVTVTQPAETIVVTETLPPTTLTVEGVEVTVPAEKVIVTETFPPVTKTVVVDREIPITYTTTQKQILTTTIKGEPIVTTVYQTETVSKTITIDTQYREDIKFSLTDGGDGNLVLLGLLAVVLGVIVWQRQK